MPVSLRQVPYTVQHNERRRTQNFSEIRKRPGVQFGRITQMLTTTVPLLAADLLAVAASVLLACAVTSVATTAWLPQLSLVVFSLSAGLVVSNLIFGLYPGPGLHPMVELRAAILSVVLTNGVLLAAMLAGRSSTQVIVLVQLAMLALLFLLPVSRSIARKFCGKNPRWGQAALVLGDGESAIQAFDALKDNPERGLRPVGILGDPMTFNRDLKGYYYVGPVNEATNVASDLSVFWAVIAMPNHSTDEVNKLIDECAAGIPNVVVTTPDGIPSLWSHAFSGLGVSGVYFQRGLLLPLPRFVKRTFDVVACLVGGIIILPLLLLIAVAIRVTSPGPVIFRQQRIGQNGKYFMACKFRTMVMNADRALEEKLNSNPAYRKEWEADHKLKDDPRVTRIGSWLRKTSLDELPQIWNTLKGEMSLVGPRPIVDAEIVKYGRDFDLYTSVLPGISGLWQVSGRNDTTYQQRVDLDTYYVRNWSPWMDIYILSKTVGVLVSRRGAY